MERDARMDRLGLPAVDAFEPFGVTDFVLRDAGLGTLDVGHVGGGHQAQGPAQVGPGRLHQSIVRQLQGLRVPSAAEGHGQ